MAQAKNKKPNVLFIFADDVGQEVLECYGGESYRTPHLDEMARSGMKFNHAYSMPVCHPSRLTFDVRQIPVQARKGDLGRSPEGGRGPHLCPLPAASRVRDRHCGQMAVVPAEG